MEPNILKQIQWLKIYAVTSTLVFAAILTMAFNRINASQRFDEIDVERINIVDRNGALKMVISNEERQHPGIVDGKPVPARKRSAGLIFFNTDGDECGGLVYDGDRKGASLALSVDQYKNDQLMQLQYNEELTAQRRVRSYGLKLWDRPDDFTLGQLLRRVDSLERLTNKSLYQKGIADMQARGLLGQERLFVGRNPQEETGLFIRDQLGKPRIKLYVDKKGEARIDLLNAKGEKIPMH